MHSPQHHNLPDRFLKLQTGTQDRSRQCVRWVPQ
uniref:Uncharacterized protein n=1 Tax=Anguilla anguilla TaxID=7936 RepID=A0A0E9TLI9_ANGAN